MEKFDAIIIGSGQGGNPLAKRLSADGWNVALIERKNLGGTCINYGCTPTKSMIASAKAAYQAKRSEEFGIKTDKIHVDMNYVARRRDEIVNNFRTGTAQAIESSGVKVIKGNACFTNADVVRVEFDTGNYLDLTARYFFLNMGASPEIPDIEGIYESGFHTSTSILKLNIVPQHMVIIGGGYIALEMAQMFRRFGSKVTILTRSGRLLTAEDEETSIEMKNILEQEGIDFYFNVQILKVQHTASGNCIVEALVDQNKNSFKGSHLLVATGRRPNTKYMNLGLAGIELDEKGYVVVDESLRTSNRQVYALGDIKAGPAFTHISYNDYLVVYNHLVKGKSIDIQNRMVPYCIFTDPELARIGLTENQATKMGLDFMTAKLPMSSVARAIEIGETRGFLKVITDRKTGHILGACVIGIQGGELMSILQIAMMGRLTAEQLKEAIFAHPTMAESINNLFLRLKEPARS